VRRLAHKPGLSFSREDVLLLPELIGGDVGRREYEGFASSLAGELGCHVVAGSHHEEKRGRRLNCGVVADPRGAILTRYEKLRPYGIESKLGIAPGHSIGRFDVGRCHVLVLVCADFWYSAVLLSRLTPRPDLILIPTFSISRRASPSIARSLWRSMAISRAYEFGVYVGISDWAYPSEYHGLKSSSVAGLSDPRPRTHNGFFSKMGRRSIAPYAIDLVRLRELRRQRKTHSFLSDEMLTGKLSR